MLVFEQAMDLKAARVGGEGLSEEERIILAVEALERELNNGGYGQFFGSSSRGYAPVIVHALRRIGCPETAEITQAALDVVQRLPMTAREIEEGAWEDNDERAGQLDACDASYFKSSGRIADSPFAFIKANRGKIEP